MSAWNIRPLKGYVNKRNTVHHVSELQMLTRMIFQDPIRISHIVPHHRLTSMPRRFLDHRDTGATQIRLGHKSTP